MRNTFVEKLLEEGERNKNFVLLTGDLGFGVFEPFAARFPDRFYNVGIAEQNMASVAAGLALAGKRVLLYSIANFPTLRCFEQIRNDIAYHKLDVKIVAIGAGVEYGSLGASHHGTEEMGAMRLLPNMRVYSPHDKAACRLCMDEMFATPGPAYMRLNKSGTDGVFDGCAGLGLTCLRGGEDVAVIGTGPILAEALAGVEASGKNAAVYSLCRIKPFDKEGLRVLLGRFQKIVTLEEHSVIGGLGSALSDAVFELGECARIKKLAIQDVFTKEVGKQAYLRERYGIGAADVAAAVKELYA